MDTRENKTPEEELQHFKEVSQPEDFEHPEPDAEQPEAKESSHGLHRVLPIVIVVIGVLAVAMLLLSGNAD
ncbi:hypothetical protein FHR95_003172 [Halomonas fontilapidosi]|uniref:Uncharacterized protein n=1 Tax=Halomonas fontilapidosi TaxID=616675 RepID=A0A7W5H0R5_9GAMM|nr:hypothetical protein [Halomonas fontilapidosi]MBB3185582.1 hypothetical protein [Halomonas fontilapidosi]